MFSKRKNAGKNQTLIKEKATVLLTAGSSDLFAGHYISIVSKYEYKLYSKR